MKINFKPIFIGMVSIYSEPEYLTTLKLKKTTSQNCPHCVAKPQVEVLVSI